jgi:2-methylcitrate dehydratase PrpD
VTHTEFHDVDPAVIQYVKMLTLKQVMGIVVGSAAPTSKKVVRYVMDHSGKPECGVYGCGFRADEANAALASGFFGRASEMEDDQFPGGGISDVTTWPALLTAADKCKLSGKEVIVALYADRRCRTGSPCGLQSGRMASVSAIFPLSESTQPLRAVPRPMN